MDAKHPAGALRLPSLSIRGLLGIPELDIPRLGRVTLLAGKNGAGKTAVLDAARIYGARGSYAALSGVLRSREEIISFVDASGDEIAAPNPEALFYGRNPTPESVVAIGPADGSRQLVIRAGPWFAGPDESFSSYNDPAMLEVEFDGQRRNISAATVFGDDAASRRWLRNRKAENGALFACRSLGPNAPGNADIAQFWDNVALTPDEDIGAQALRLVYGDAVNSVAVIGDPRSAYGRRAMVSIKGQYAPVPLRSLGDGAVRMLGVALALANFRGGMLLIDEAENGIHHSLQCGFWKMVIQAAYDYDVQVIATTHSWDAIDGFAKAIADLEMADCRKVSLTRRYGKVFATTLDGHEIQIAVRHNIEVR